jgi:hypothetical protein
MKLLLFIVFPTQFQHFFLHKFFAFIIYLFQFYGDFIFKESNKNLTTMYKLSKQLLLICGACLIFTSTGLSQTVNFTNAKIYCPEKKDKLVLESINVLQEEIAKRSDIKLTTTKRLKSSAKGIIVVGTENNTDKLPEEYRQIISRMHATGKEGYKIISINESKSILVIGNDARGVLYGMDVVP